MTATFPSLETVYRDHGSWLVGWLSARAGCRTRASDLAQETFCRLAEKPGLRLQSHPRRYLATVARRLLIDDVRRKESERSFLEAYACLVGTAEQPGPDRIVQAVEDLAALYALLGELPAKVCGAFLMSRLDGLGYAEIAGEIGVSISMIKQYVARALAHCYLVAHDCPD